jgi:hypothetical protein
MAHLPMSADENRCATEELVDVLLGMVSGRGMLEQVCTNLPEMSDPTTVRGYLNAQLAAGNLADHVWVALQWLYSTGADCATARRLRLARLP